MTYKNLVEVWSSYKHPENKLILELEENHLSVLEPVSRNEIIRFMPKIKVKVLRLLLENLGFVSTVWSTFQ